MKTVRLNLVLTYDDTFQNPPLAWNWPGLLDLSPHESVRVTLADPGAMPMACTAGEYSVEQRVTGEESTDFGVFRVNDDGSVDWTDDLHTQGWERMRFTAHGETPESIGALIGDMIRDTVPEQWCEDGEIVVEFIRP